MRMVLFAAGAAFLLADPAEAQSLVQRCAAAEQQPEAGPPGRDEFCKGVLAAAGYGQTQDRAAAWQHYVRAAEQGFVEAEATVGAGYDRGWVGPADPAQAAAWYAKAAAQGHVGASYNLGLLYAAGRGVPKNLDEARRLIGFAADHGMEPARAKLAELSGATPAVPPGQEAFEEGKRLYIDGDKAGALPHFAEAARAGDLEAMYEMGYMNEFGEGGLAENPGEAAKWYLAASEKGQRWAEDRLGQLYFNGKGVPEDWVTAARWYLKSAEQGWRDGQFHMGQAYEYGVGVPLDQDQAVGWYDKASAQGDGQSTYFAQYIRDNGVFDQSALFDEEQQLIGPDIMRWFPIPAPIGAVFHNKAERLAWAQKSGRDLADARNRALYNMRKDKYEACRSSGQSGCMF